MHLGTALFPLLRNEHHATDDEVVVQKGKDGQDDVVWDECVVVVVWRDAWGGANELLSHFFLKLCWE